MIFCGRAHLIIADLWPKAIARGAVQNRKMSNEPESLVAPSSSLASKNSGLMIMGVQSLSSSPSSVSAPPTKRKRSSLDVKSLQAASFSQTVTQAPSSAYRIGFLGAGNMARALAEGMIASGDPSICVLIWLRVWMFLNYNPLAGQVSRSAITASATSSTSENLRKMKVVDYLAYSNLKKFALFSHA